MFSDRALTELEARRQQLIAAAKGHRTRLQSELLDLTDSVRWVNRAAGWLRGMRPLLWVVAPAAGFLLARRGWTVLRWLPSVLPWWRVVRSVAARIGAKES